jgi:hypothetical protein
VKIRPAKVINGVIVHELIFMFSGGAVLHSGVLTSNYLAPASSPIYLFYYHKELTPELKELLMKRFGKK